jgi:hypothetical protein
LCAALLALPALDARSQRAPELRVRSREPTLPRELLGRRADLRCHRALALRGGAELSAAREYQEAIKWTGITMAATLVFGLGVIPFKGRDASLDFFTGFLIEKILSVDNLFVFVMLFDAFKTPEAYQRKVLTIGIFSAIVLRGIMIAVGVGLVQSFRQVLLAFAAILIASSAKV